MRAFGRAFRHLGHEVIEYDALSDTAPPFGRPDINVCYQLATKWIPPDAQSVQVWASDPADDPRAMESVIQRQKEMDLAFFANKEWLDKAIYDEGLYAGHYLQLGIDTLVEPSGVACRKHKLGIFGGPYPGRVGELSVLVHEGIDMAIWGPAWENVPQLKRFHQGVIADEAEMLAAMNSCEVVGILPRGSEMPWSYWQAMASSAKIMVGFEDILHGRYTLGCATRSMIDVATEMLAITTEHMEKHKGRVITHIEVDDPWGTLTVKFPNHGDVHTFDLDVKAMGDIDPDAIPTILRRAALAVENERTGNGLAKRMELDDGKVVV